MKYLFLKNKIEIKDKILKYYIIQLILLFAYVIINNNVIKYFDLKNFSSMLGLESIKDAYFLDILIKITSYLVIAHLIVKIFTENMLKTIQYIMLRLDNKKWIIYEIFNFSVYVIVMRIVYNLFLYIMFVIFDANIDIATFIIVMAKDIMFYVVILLLVISLLNLFSLNGYNKILSLIPFILILFTFFISIRNISSYILLIFIIVLTVINVKIFVPCRFYTEYCNK